MFVLSSISSILEFWSVRIVRDMKTLDKNQSHIIQKIFFVSMKVL